jgi:hypothetical protein
MKHMINRDKTEIEINKKCMKNMDITGLFAIFMTCTKDNKNIMRLLIKHLYKATTCLP